MSRFIKTRTPDQCRSHHQKILKFNHNIDNILTIYMEKLLRQTSCHRVKIEDTADS